MSKLVPLLFSTPKLALVVTDKSALVTATRLVEAMLRPASASRRTTVAELGVPIWAGALGLKRLTPKDTSPVTCGSCNTPTTRLLKASPGLKVTVPLVTPT